MGQLKDCIEAEKSKPYNLEVKNSLKQEIMHLQDLLQDQFVERCALEKALSYKPSFYENMTDISIPKPTENLIKEIAVLQFEIVHLEKYLLSMYRKKFDQQTLSLSTTEETSKPNSSVYMAKSPEVAAHEIPRKKIISSSPLILPRNSVQNPTDEHSNIWANQGLVDSSIHRSHSALSERSIEVSPSMESLANAINSFHSLPLSILEKTRRNKPYVHSLTDQIGNTPNFLSEEMVKCISAIYCELADPPLIYHDYSFSPISTASSINGSPAEGQGTLCSPQYKSFSSFNPHIDNPFRIGKLNELSGPYRLMTKIERICRDGQKLRDIENKLQTFGSLIYQLEQVDPRRLKHEEKLAFWINVHNSLVMHAYVVHGIPQNNMKRMSKILKAAYNVGGHNINVDMIQTSILGCQLPRPGQWLRALFSSKMKFKTGDMRRHYAIEHPEPRLYFALCSGSGSDPAVRLYTSKRVFEDLETAKEEYIQSSFKIHKENRVLLPKLAESFVKHSNLCLASLVEMTEDILPDSRIQQSQHKKFAKNMEWIPHNFTFGYLLSRELL